MLLGGWQKLTTLDYPGVVSSILFAQGCNFNCPYCHNQSTIAPGPSPQGPSLSAVMATLRQRRQKGILDGVVISGGEPTLQAKALEELCRQLKDMGYLLKLDSNGSRPRVLERLLEQNLLDYVALDIKALPERYAACALPAEAADLRRSITLARRIAHEFRTTAVAPFVRPADVPALVELIGPASPWFLQKARDWRGHGIEGALSEAEIAAMAAQARALGGLAALR